LAKYNIKGHKWWWDNYLHDNMQLILEKAIPNKWDCLGIIFGKEGAGKTTLASQLAMFCDHNFTLDHTVFTPEEFLQVTDNCKEESSILWDEAITGATAQQQGNEISQAVISRLTTIRRKKLKIFICFPYLHMLNKYFISRCLFSIYVYAKGFDKRGYMYFYNQKRSEVLYELMKNRYSYNPLAALRKVKSSFYCTYPNHLCLPEEEYQDKKEESTRSNAKPSYKELKYRTALAILIDHVTKKKMLNYSNISKLISVKRDTIRVLLNELNSK